MVTSLLREPAVALSVQQPWAWLIAHGWKPVENRTWRTSFRGPLWIHAGQRFDLGGYEWVRMEFPEVPLPPKAAFQRGGIVGWADLHDCVDSHGSPWFFGPHGFLMRDAAPVEFRPCRGQLGFFQVLS
jgi:hypothetical protein